MQNKIVLNSIFHRYDSRGLAGINNLSLNIDSKKMNFLMGPSGCGKTTLLKIIAQKLRPDKGDVKVNLNIVELPEINHELSQLSVFELLNELCGHNIPEENHRYHLIRQNLLTLELTNQIHQKFENLSSGQQQRVRIAHCLNLAAEFILLDEPFSHLDHFLKKDFYHEFKEVLSDKGIGTLWVCHEIQEAYEFADHLYFMNHGEIIQEGTPEQMYLNPNSAFSARYSGEVNRFVSTIKSKSESELILKTSIGDIKLDPKNLNAAQLASKNEKLLLIRPQAFKVSDHGPFKFKVDQIKFKGPYYLLQGKINDQQVIVQSDARPTEGQLKLELQHMYIQVLAEL